MKIKFLGTGAAEGVPAMFCSCKYCKNIRAMGKAEYRRRTQILIDDELSIDFPPEAFSNSLDYGVNLSALKYLLVTHSHMDHFYAHDFILRGYKYGEVEEDKLHIFGNTEVKAVYDECTAREMKPQVKEHLAFTVIKPYSVFSFGKYRVIAIPANHGNVEDCLLYYVEKEGKGYLHLHDTGVISDEAIDFLAANGAKANAVAFDCTFVEEKVGDKARHMGIYENMLVKEKLLERGIINGNTQIIATHFSHNANPTRAHLAEIENNFNVKAAFDGYTTEI